MDELERISLAAYLPVYGDDAVRVGGATCLRAPLAPDSPMLNRIVGLGVGAPEDGAVVDAALAAMGDTSFYVAVSPDADPTLDRLLEERGLERGWGWMLFERTSAARSTVETALTVTEVGRESAAAWARVVLDGYGLPDACAPLVERVPGLPGWHAFLARDGDEPVASAAVWLDGDAAYFGFAATRAEHRGKGGQGALFAARIDRALEAGCTTLVTETGERRDDRPSNSYRNILRYGFEERFVVAQRLRRRPAPQSTEA
jgi:GNAT superfamily N-acetyltransferase